MFCPFPVVMRFQPDIMVIGRLPTRRKPDDPARAVAGAYSRAGSNARPDIGTADHRVASPNRTAAPARLASVVYPSWCSAPGAAAAITPQATKAAIIAFIVSVTFRFCGPAQIVYHVLPILGGGHPLHRHLGAGDVMIRADIE